LIDLSTNESTVPTEELSATLAEAGVSEGTMLRIDGPLEHSHRRDHRRRRARAMILKTARAQKWGTIAERQSFSMLLILVVSAEGIEPSTQ
jgi:hypothetical protein